MQRRFEEPFALEGQPLFRYDLIKLADDHYYWLLQYHHLSIDGWGVALLNRSWGRSTASWPPQRLPIWRLPPTRPTSKTTGPMSNRRSLSSSGPFGDNTILSLQSPCSLPTTADILPVHWRGAAARRWRCRERFTTDWARWRRLTASPFSMCCWWLFMSIRPHGPGGRGDVWFAGAQPCQRRLQTNGWIVCEPEPSEVLCGAQPELCGVTGADQHYLESSLSP